MKTLLPTCKQPAFIRAGQAELLAEELNQQGAVFDFRRHLLPIHRQ